MNAPIRYFGGKGGMFNQILPFFPEKEAYDTYIEPFGGSYSIGFKMDYIPPVEIYNDLDRNVYSLYKVLSDKELFEKFKEKCDLAYYSQDIRRECKEKLKSFDLDILERAFCFFYVNRTSHNGIGGLSVNTIVRRNMAKSVSDMLSCVDRLPETHQRLSRLVVLNEDALKLIKRYYDRGNVFMYLDPPYIHDTRGDTRYDVDMTDEQHEEFINICCEAKCKMLISGYDNPLYDKLLKNGFVKVDFGVNTVDGTGKPKKKTETLWKNY